MFSITSSEHTLMSLMFPHRNILRAAHFWSNTTCKLFLRTVPVLFNKAFIGSNLHLDFHRTATLQLRRVTFERRGIWIWKEHMPSFRRENITQHYTHTGYWTVCLAHGLYTSSSLSFRGLWMDCAACSDWVWAWKTFFFFQQCLVGQKWRQCQFPSHLDLERPSLLEHH